MKKVLISVFISFSVLLLFSINNINSNDTIDRNREDGYSFNTDYTVPSVNNYLPYSELRSDSGFNITMDESYLSTLIDSKIIMISDAKDLYNWSKDLSYVNNGLSQAGKEALASLNYVLGNDIDYSVMKSQRFMPIGYYINEDEKLSFSGTFDGRGLEIKNLYYESFGSFSYEENNIIRVYGEQFSMFIYNEGKITNLGLINPIIDLENESSSLIGYSYLVGLNKSSGEVLNSYVEDNRDSANSGINASVSGNKEAGAIVYSNEGLIDNVYFAGINVVKSEYAHAIAYEPIVYENTGTVTNVVYHENFVKMTNSLGVSITPTYGVEKNLLNQTESSTVLNNYFYYTNNYPKRWGLDFVDNKYQILDAVDFLYFTKLLKLNQTWRGRNYLLVNDIDLLDISHNTFETLSVEFSGSLVGKIVNDKLPQINNLSISKGINIGSGYYLGIFSILSGTFENIILYNMSLEISNTKDYVNQTFFVGSVAGKLSNNGKIKNVNLKNVTIDLDTNGTNNKLGTYVVGGFVGEASGTIEKVLNDEGSSIKIGSQKYETTEKLGNSFYLGGIVGKTGSTRLDLYNAKNNATIESIVVTNNLYVVNNSPVNFYIGGIIGYVKNEVNIKHNLGLLTNDKSINNHSISSSNMVNSYIGGIIGYSEGSMYLFSNTYGVWKNTKDFINENTNNNNQYIAGVLNSNHSEAVEFVQIFNNGSITVNNTSITAASLVNHLSNTKLTVSQAVAKGNITVSVNKDISLAVNTSSNSSELQLNYVEVKTNLAYTSNITSETSVAGVTLNENANFLNVVYGGDIIFNISSANSILWVAGITKLLSSDKYIKNGLNEGSIDVDVVSNSNIYVAGIVNRNLSGDLHNQDSQLRPRATTGIINSVNMSDIDVDNSSTGNMFIGGIVTMNGGNDGGSIQDSVNFGNITGVNSNNSGSASFTGEGGLVNSYNSGVNTGGIAVLITDGLTRIYDVSNSGNVTAISYNFARSGGIVSTALADEFNTNTGKIDSEYYSNVVTATDEHNLKNSIISNALNMGDVYAVASSVPSYTNTKSTESPLNFYSEFFPYNGGITLKMESAASSGERIGVSASSGGIIAYGLVTLFRTINHGIVASVDAAGGIMGATRFYVTKDYYSSAFSKNIGVTVVNINTAINYGDIRSIYLSNFSSILSRRSVLSSDFRDYNDTFITPSSSSSDYYSLSSYPQGFDDYIRRHPEAKRGIGGIFGRIQRAGDQFIWLEKDGESGSFDFIVNMNENVDLIGRLDQNRNFSFSIDTYDFTGAIFYSANPNDRTQAVFSGYEFVNKKFVEAIGDNATIYVDYTYSGYRNNYKRSAVYTILNADSIIEYSKVYVQKGSNANLLKNETTNTYNQSSKTYNVSNISVTNSEYNNQKQDGYLSEKTFKNSSKENDWEYLRVHPIPNITENPSEADSDTKYVYDENFIMRDDDTLLTTGESITSYIYYAENSLLNDFPNGTSFKDSRPNGMYVLATSSGSTYGSILPRNFNLTDLRKLDYENNTISNSLNYENVNDTLLVDNDLSLQNSYKELYQTKSNDKSALLVDDQRVVASDDSLNLDLFYYDNEFTSNEIIFDLDTSFLGANRSISLKIEDLLIPENALVARLKESSETEEQFRLLLSSYVASNPNSKIATESLAPILDYTLPENLIDDEIYTIGQFISYSESAINDSNLSSYKTLYTVKVRLVVSSISDPIINGSKIDEASSYTSTVDDLTITNKVSLRFYDYGLLSQGYELNNIELYYDDYATKVDNEYYTVNRTPLIITQSGRYFYVEIIFSEELRNGAYKFKYSYYNNYNNGVYSVVNINYNRERSYDILDFIPYTGTSYDGNTADIAFDYNLYKTVINDDSKYFTKTEVDNRPPYLDNYEYEIDFIEHYAATSFFDISSINVTEDSDEDYKVYTITFNLENGTIVTKTIKETKLSPSVFKDGVRVITIYEDNDIHASSNASREASFTTFTLDYDFHNLDLYNTSNFKITYQYEQNESMNVLQTNTSETMIYYYTNSNDKLNIVLTQLASPGTYTVSIKYQRDDISYNAGTLVIEKIEGVDAYLKNIKFSDFVQGLEYPDINVIDTNNKIKMTGDEKTYTPNVYYAGIDYNESDTNKEKRFIIDGEVAGTPLNDYTPTFLLTGYLPIGAKISRKAYDEDGNVYWTPLVDVNSSISDQEMLKTDFTIDPQSGDFTEDLVYIEYRIIPENLIPETQGSIDLDTIEGGITYRISVTDVKYSFLSVFKIYYDDGINNPVLISDTNEFNQKLLLLYINNYSVSDANNNEISDNVNAEENANNNQEIFANFPSFTNLVTRKSSITMFYYNDTSVQDYIYRVGNNYSGFYQFSMELPAGYKYQVYLDEIYDSSSSLINYSDNELPLLNTMVDSAKGYYYYINASPRTRTRYFSIIISADTQTDSEWGLVDNNTTWN
ncbi:MAG: hypothetical protein RBQ97_06530 [Acholeplasma sp.]|nr:hypothetical protein [Acholeplasma sp.]